MNQSAYFFSDVKIDGVSESRPAQKAGMLKGDIVVKMGNHKVNNMMDYKKEHFSSQFVFKNPNETERCGCGESFKI